jgi:hypothetical protein
MARKVKDYSNGKVYVIRNIVNDKVYIGSTTQPLSKRMVEHRGNVTNTKRQNYKIYQNMHEIGVEHFYIELLELCPCETKEQLNKREGELIRQHNSVADGYNSVIAGRTKHEYYQAHKDILVQKQRAYYKANKDQLVEQQREFYQNNKEKVKEQAHTQYQANKDHILKQKHEYRQANKEQISNHKREYYLANKDQLEEKKREYRQANQDKIAEKKREYYQANKVRIAQKQRERVISQYQQG